MEELNWPQFEEACRACRRCGLADARTQVVIGRGKPHPVPLLFVGEGPGEQEDRQGEAFVGRAGKLLDLALTALRFSPDEWYIANIVKCRPPGNREPTDEEAAACLPWLRWQVRTLRPSVIVCLGRTAAKHLIDRSIRMSSARGSWVRRQEFWLMPTWHPAAVLRDPGKRTEFFLDLEQARARLDDMRRTQDGFTTRGS